MVNINTPELKRTKTQNLPDFSILNHQVQTVTKSALSKPLAKILNFLAYLTVFGLLIVLPLYGLYRALSPSMYIDVLNSCYINLSSQQYTAKDDIKEMKYVLDSLRKSDFPDYKNVCKYVSRIKTPVTLCSQSDAMGCTQPNTGSIEVSIGKIMPSMEVAEVGGAIVHESCHIAQYKNNYKGDLELPCYLDQNRAEGSMKGY